MGTIHPGEERGRVKVRSEGTIIMKEDLLQHMMDGVIMTGTSYSCTVAIDNTIDSNTKHIHGW